MTSKGEQAAETGEISRPGYLAALVGAYVGAPIGAGLTLGLAWLAWRCPPEGGFECVVAGVVILLVAYVGLLAGPMVGCFVGLRLRGYAHGLVTSVLMLGLIVAGSVVFAAVGRIEDLTQTPYATAGTLVAPLVALPARWLTLRIRGAGEDG